MKKAQIFLNLYLVTAIVHIFSIVSRYGQVETVSKIILMPLLIAYVFSESKGHRKTVYFLFLALLLSWAGDISLLNSDKEIFFMMGLIAFLLAHAAYIITFKKLRWRNMAKKNMLLGIPFILYALMLFFMIRTSLGTMLVPVILYTVCITWMGIAAIQRRGKTAAYSFLFVAAGAISFIFSDSMIAVNRFYHPFDQAPVLIMLTYSIAQYLIATGCIQHLWQLKNE